MRPRLEQLRAPYTEDNVLRVVLSAMYSMRCVGIGLSENDLIVGVDCVV